MKILSYWLDIIDKWTAILRTDRGESASLYRDPVTRSYTGQIGDKSVYLYEDPIGGAVKGQVGATLSALPENRTVPILVDRSGGAVFRIARTKNRAEDSPP
ncbi:hypothetical protein [Candidatus Methylacidithermus pantelleriae]|uniref:Uncharacterized protein n=1 Tax=Candidatus Methylacidithermus pantelleriae TaxID=2744239 RepID=A0A8J2BR92_9BACT|nr:hypothetical protein [Candidatus Methylacidithermus pantelleriae]CAF0692991.1 hypothetical protein MPNT_130034 [Candidatus Methylacidithermus pantelleriae]